MSLLILKLGHLLVLQIKLLPLHLDLILLVLNLPEGFLLSLYYPVVVSDYFLIKLIQLSQLRIVIPLHILQHGMECVGQAVHLLLIGCLELCVHPLDCIDVYLLYFQVVNGVCHPFSI